MPLGTSGQRGQKEALICRPGQSPVTRLKQAILQRVLIYTLLYKPEDYRGRVRLETWGLYLLQLFWILTKARLIVSDSKAPRHTFSLFFNFLFLHFYLKEAIATSEELGQDLEHVQLLQKKFEEFQTDLAAHEERVNEVNQLAAKLIQESHPEAELIVRKQDEVNAAWQRLKGLAQQRQGKLFGAAEVQRFNR